LLEEGTTKKEILGRAEQFLFSGQKSNNTEERGGGSPLGKGEHVKTRGVYNTSKQRGAPRIAAVSKVLEKNSEEKSYRTIRSGSVALGGNGAKNYRIEGQPK